MDWFSDVQQVYSHWTVTVHLVLLLFAVLAAKAITRRVLTALSERLDPREQFWRHALVTAAGPPAQIALWLVGLAVAIKVIIPLGPDPSPVVDTLTPVVGVAGVATATWFLIRFTVNVERGIYAYAERLGKPLDRMGTEALGKLVQAAIITIGLLEALRILGLSASGLLAVGGVGGVALGLAAQGLVSNLLGGLTVYVSQPFKVGEWVIMPEENVMGEVQDIGWRATRILGFDRRPFYVPNSKFNTAIVINHSRMTNRRIMEYVHVRYEDIDKIAAIVRDVREHLRQHPGISQDFFVVNFDSYGDYALKLFIYAFTITTSYAEYMQIKEDVLLETAAIIRRHGARLAVPTSTVHMPEGVRFYAAIERAGGGQPQGVPAGAAPADAVEPGDTGEPAAAVPRLDDEVEIQGTETAEKLKEWRAKA